MEKKYIPNIQNNLFPIDTLNITIEGTFWLMLGGVAIFCLGTEAEKEKRQQQQLAYRRFGRKDFGRRG